MKYVIVICAISLITSLTRFISLIKFKKTFFDPILIYQSTWFLASIINILFNDSFYGEGYFWIKLDLFADELFLFYLTLYFGLLVGEYLIFSEKKEKNLEDNGKQVNLSKIEFKKLKKFVFIIILLSFFCFGLMIYQGFPIKNLFSNRGYLLEQGESAAGGPLLYLTLLGALSIAYSAEILCKFGLSNRKVQQYLLISILFPPFVQMAFTAGRSGLFIPLFIFAFMKYKDANLKESFKEIFKFALLAIFIFTIMGILRGDNSILKSFSRLSFYLGGPIDSFEYHSLYSTRFIGGYPFLTTGSFIIRQLSKININIPNYPIGNPDIILVNNLIRFGIPQIRTPGTMFMKIYLDFDLLFGLLFVFLYGLFVSKINKSKDNNSLVLVLKSVNLYQMLIATQMTFVLSPMYLVCIIISVIFYYIKRIKLKY